jgi:adenylate cyclase
MGTGHDPNAASAPVTVLFADISGSTLMYAVRGDEVAFKLTSTCLTVLEEQVVRSGGRVIKRVGDAILAAFESAEAAVRAAAGMQRALESPDCPVRGEGVLVRVGIASGTAVHDEGDIYGDIVNVAARLVSLAGADEIFLTGESHATLPVEMQASTRPIDQLALRGRPDWVQVHEYMWKQEGATVRAGVGMRARGEPASLTVTYGPQTFTLGTERPKLTIGRDPDNDVTIEDDVVSRRHAEIVLRGDKFLVVDRSTNGTWILTDGGDTFRLNREELTLAGSGRILPGSQALEPLRYRLAPRPA